MRTDQPGLPDVLDEIDVNQPTIGVEIGIGDKLISNLNDIGARISRINDFLPAALKLVELLEETKAKLENDRYNIISSIATLVDKTRICGSVDLYAAYEKTRAYRSAIGKKAAATRKKNAEAQASDQGAAAA